MSLFERLKPDFWDHRDARVGPFKHLFDFRRIWALAVALSAGIALVPVISMAVFDYRVTQEAMEQEILLRTSRLVSNTRRTVSFFLTERKAALDFIVHHNTFEELDDSVLLTKLLQDLQKTFGGVVDLGVIDSQGRQRTYVGPYELEGVDYSDQAWFQEVLTHGVYISDVFLGFRQVPHVVIAIRHDLPDRAFFVLRATLDTKLFNNLLSQLELGGRGDAFMINQEGRLQTPTRYHGKVLEKVSLPVPEYSSRTEVLEQQGANDESVVVGYAYITETPFILMIVKDKGELMEPWQKTRLELIGFLGVSITAILVVILGGVTHLVGKIHLADEKRVMTLHQMEYANKMASIGRLAAGVAHEINNPLAIINEKAGLIQDIFTLKEEYAKDEKLMDLVHWIIASVERCASITKRLLSFARHTDVSIERVHLREVIDDVIALLAKEAEYRSITVNVDADRDMSHIFSDRGKLEQIFLNLVNNAFAAMSDGGRLDIKVKPSGRQSVLVEVSDDGCGIPKADLDRIFEPFFSTKKEKGGTGLGLSITYGLVQELGGKLSVASVVGMGTTFSITLPHTTPKKKSQENESTIGR
jgi:two-component system NtrC family sensor kinase